jgi:hypothetical protein
VVLPSLYQASVVPAKLVVRLMFVVPLPLFTGV